MSPLVNFTNLQELWISDTEVVSYNYDIQYLSDSPLPIRHLHISVGMTLPDINNLLRPCVNLTVLNLRQMCPQKSPYPFVSMLEMLQDKPLLHALTLNSIFRLDSAGLMNTTVCSACERISNIPIEYLDLRYNRITFISRDFLRTFAYVTVLDLSYNSMSMELFLLLEKMAQPFLEFLNIENQVVKDIKDGAIVENRAYDGEPSNTAVQPGDFPLLVNDVWFLRTVQESTYLQSQQ